MFKLKIIAPTRGTDGYGSGYFGASRGSRSHKGIDKSCYPGSLICSLIGGIVTKLGYPYADDLSFRYVEVTSADSYRHRFFYVSPLVTVGDLIEEGCILGSAQNLNIRYKNNMTGHIHYEIMLPLSKGKKYIDPKVYYE